MMPTSFWFLLALGLHQVDISSACDAYVIKTHTWNHGYVAKLYLDQNWMTSSTLAWNLTLIFNKHIKEFKIWDADIAFPAITENVDEVIVTNKCYNPILYACQFLELSFLVRFPDDNYNKSTLDYDIKEIMEIVDYNDGTEGTNTYSTFCHGSNLLITSNITRNAIETIFENITQTYGNLIIFTQYKDKKEWMQNDSKKDINYTSNANTEELTDKILKIYKTNENQQDLNTKLDVILKEIDPGNPEQKKLTQHVVEASKTISNILKPKTKGGSDKLETLCQAIVNNTELINHTCPISQNDTTKYLFFREVILFTAAGCIEDKTDLSCANGAVNGFVIGLNTAFDMSMFSFESACFAGTGKVETILGIKNISELEIGDFVRTSFGGFNTHFTEFIGWLSRQKYSPIKMLQVSTTQGVSSVTLTGNHIIFTQNSTKYAYELVPGDSLVYWNGSQIVDELVKEISETVVIGSWTPLTRDGTLMVDGYLASCYAHFNHQLADLALIRVKAYPKLLLDNEKSQHIDGVRPAMKLMKNVGGLISARKSNVIANELCSLSNYTATHLNHLNMKLCGSK